HHSTPSARTALLLRMRTPLAIFERAAISGSAKVTTFEESHRNTRLAVWKNSPPEPTISESPMVGLRATRWLSAQREILASSLNSIETQLVPACVYRRKPVKKPKIVRAGKDKSY